MRKKVKLKRRKGLFATKERKVTIFLGLFIMTIMIASVLNLYDAPSEKNVYEYQGTKFFNTENGWVAHLSDGRSLAILSNPKELENITINKVPLSLLNSMDKIYFSINPLDQNREALYEFQRGIQPKLTPRIVQACYEDNERCTDLPLKTCEDSTENIGIIVLKESNETKVNMKYNCLTIQGNNLLKLVDKIILQDI